MLAVCWSRGCKLKNKSENILCFAQHILSLQQYQLKSMTKRAIVIGASSGIGHEVARLLVADGWKTGVAARRVERLELLKQSATDDDVLTAEIDVTAEYACERLTELIGRLGGMDLFFYASGIGKQNYNLDESIEMQTVMTNGAGFCRMVGCAYRYMAENGGGQIAVISSIAGTKGLGAAPSYSATKALQNRYIEALAQQANMRRLNISFTDLRPGFVATALLGNDPYPMLMQADKVAREIVKAVYSKKRVRVIDWRWRILTAAWSLIPGCIWRRLPIGFPR